MTQILIDPRFHLHPKQAEIYSKVKAALKYFPELKEVTLAAYRPGKGQYKDSPVAAAGKDMIAFNVHIMPSSNTIFHELQHKVQHQKGLRLSETDATIFGLARMPKKMVEHNELSYIGAVPKSKVVDYAKFAVKEAKKGNKSYLKTMKAKISKDYKAATKGDKAKEKAWTSEKGIDANIKAKPHTKQYAMSFMKKYVGGNPPKNIFDDSGKKHIVYRVEKMANPPEWMKSGKQNKVKKPSR